MPVCIVVDDHEDTREGYTEFFTVSGFTAIGVANARALFEALARVRPDVIILDLQLPEVDGWDLTRMLKADRSLGDVPIVAVSGCVLPSERARAEEAGCAVFLPKPCDPGLILAEVKRLLGDP